MESSKVLQEIDPVSGAKIDHPEPENEPDLLGESSIVGENSPNKYNFNVDPKVLEKSLNMTNEIIQMA
jgi:hypothetical protein